MELLTCQRVFARIDEDIDTINRSYGLMSSEHKDMLLKDIKYLLLDNIAREIRLVFYDPQNRDSVFFQYVYALDARTDPGSGAHNRRGEPPMEAAFDVFVEFTEGFLRLDSEDQTLLLQNTELDWFTHA
jgi:hypothetical protein